MPKLKPKPTCTVCGSDDINRRGFRKNKMETLPLYFCKRCGRKFSEKSTVGKTYPLPIILEALSLYHLGHTLTEVSDKFKKKSHLKVNRSTIGTWVAEHKELCTYNQLREEGRKLYNPRRLIRKTILPHKQIYQYRIHQAKVEILFDYKTHQTFSPIRDYLEDMLTNCPHDLFLNPNSCSKLKASFSRDNVEFRKKTNKALQLAQLALQVAPNNRARHDTLQNFMLINDSATIATEVPVYLTPDDLDHLKEQLGFVVPLTLEKPTTGHIDLLQIRDKAIHILDYKPNAKKEKQAIDQLTLYALSLSRRTGLKLFDFKCAWFDEKDYFEFYPLHMVYKPPPRRRGELI